MADKKISALTGASTPLAGTEVLPIVQSGSTVKVSVANLTVGRDVTMANATVNGHVNVLAGDVRFDDERFVYSYAGGTIGQFMSGTYYDGSGLTQRVFLNNAEVGRWTGTDLKIDNGNLIIGTSGKGIDFSATPGTGTSELLNDYEEGTYTPTVTASSGTLTTVTATGNYTKIGRQVTVNVSVTLTDAGTGSGALLVTLPFTAGLFPSIGTGRENENTGTTLQIRIQSTIPGSMVILTITNTTIIATSNVVFGTITYFV